MANPLLLFLPCFFSAVAAITPGSTLRSSDRNPTWSSPNAVFSLGFVPNPTDSNSFLAAITYSGIDTAIWSIDTAVDATGSLQFLASGDLNLVNGSGSTVWSSNTTGRGITSAALDDSGNLVLKNTTGTVWSSFDHPTDTVVQNQTFRAGQFLTSGPYSFTLSTSGSLILTWNSSIVYWKNSSVGTNLTSPILNLQSSGILSISDPSLPSNSSNIYYSSDYGEGDGVFRFLKLDSDGNLRIYGFSKGTGTVTASWAAVLDQCRVFGFCGDFGICRYKDSNPVCTCPSRNFEFLDPNDTRKGCKRKEEIEDCLGNATMLQLDHALFLTYEPESSSQIFTLGIASCKGNCLKSGSCGCSTTLSDGSGICYLKPSGYLVSGYQNPTIPSTSFVKVCGPIDPNPTSSDGAEGHRSRACLVAVVSLSTILGLILVGCGLLFWCFRSSTRFGLRYTKSTVLEYTSSAPVRFSYKELQRLTKDFKVKLGHGGFGAVYKGVLANGTAVAVKRLEGIEQGEKQFRMEVATISSTHHLNLVRLIGFCSEGRRRLLVYEFLNNGSLDSFLFANESWADHCLGWESRFNIAIGSARGIAYLHEECSDCIIHCDLKPENILLDENYNAKLSDFGLARLVNPKHQRHQTLKSHVSGTRGYLAPEWLSNLSIGPKSDLYSFGMVLLEIVGGRRNFEVSEETQRKKFSSWAFDEFEKGNLVKIIDKRLLRFDQDVNMDQVMRVVKVGFWCIQEQPSQRPTIRKVVHMLEGVAEIKRPPAPKVTTDPASSSSSLQIGGVFLCPTSENNVEKGFPPHLEF